jgi:glucosamine--fructose-6-phosphate aminotransferase (isomerizing)
MCGIVGYVGAREAAPILVQGLRRLEYRGYDSAGVAVKNGGPATVTRSPGKLIELEKRLASEPSAGNVGIGHTRWATHGRPSEANAHPHKAGSISLVHNGIIENHGELRARLVASGRTLSSDTDSEVLAHLIDEALQSDGDGDGGDLARAVCKALRQVTGSYAIAVISDLHADRLVAAKSSSPLVVGLGEGETFVASDVSAMLEHTREMIFLDEGDVVELTPAGARICDVNGQVRPGPATTTVDWSSARAEKDGYPHFMLKEIHEQPGAVAETLRGRIRPETGDAELDGFTLDVSKLRRVVLLACGSSYHACLVGKYFIESMARLPCEVDLASEFRYRDPVVGAGDLVIAISQSGETADTLAALREARVSGALTLAISNVAYSPIPRAAEAALYTRAGLEIGVASTKAFTAQLAALAAVALHLGRRTGALGQAAGVEIANELMSLPGKMQEALDLTGDLSGLVAQYVDAQDVFFVGRGPNFPIALEGALKLKEISYIHAEGYAAGEMKHGPIALICDQFPVVVLAPAGPSYDKVVSNLAEVRARGARIIAVATVGDATIESQVDAVLWIPPTLPLFQPLLSVLPLQMLAYAVAVAKGNDVDQPRNLAKSVTVE